MEQIRYKITFKEKYDTALKQELVIDIYTLIEQLRILFSNDYLIVSVKLLTGEYNYGESQSIKN